VLWVKGSGGDLGSIKLDGFSTLYMDKLHALKGRYRGLGTKTRWWPTCRTAPST
jgi:rhamnose utilization protein RhaD (predicted bifunctional aldolase and dehydrogenase)